VPSGVTSWADALMLQNSAHAAATAVKKVFLILKSYKKQVERKLEEMFLI
jgi:hypothetical protein